MNRIISHLDKSHFGNNCEFERDQIFVHLFNGSLRLRDITHVMKPGKPCEEFTFNWNWHIGKPPGLYKLFERHGYNLRSVFNELLALDWQHATSYATGETLDGWKNFNLPELVVRLPEFGVRGEPGESVELYRGAARSMRCWSPFATVNPLPERPKKWTIPHVIRALMSGQFTDLKCNGVYTDDYAYDNSVNYQQGEIKDAIAFARSIMESPSGWWTGGENDAVSICCHSFDSNSFKFNLMGRFSPIKSKLAAVPVTVAVADSAKNKNNPPAQKKSASEKFNSGSPQGVTLSENEAKNGLQLHFTGKPDEEIRAEMKAAGWRWSFRNACWYHRHTPENKIWAEAFVARLTPTSSAAPVASVTPPAVEPTPRPEPEQTMTTLPQAESASPLPAVANPPPASNVVHVQFPPRAPLWRRRLA